MKKLRITILYDRSPDQSDEKEHELAMAGTGEDAHHHLVEHLSKAGHDVALHGVHDDVKALIAAIESRQPEIVFNLCESFRGDSAMEFHIPALLEMLGARYTGSGPGAIMLALDKGLAKKVLAYHGLWSADFTVYPRGQFDIRPSKLRFPLIVKPLTEDASIGIAESSVVRNDDALAARISYVHEKIGCAALVEEYIEGRELFVGVIGNDRPTILPPMELDFSKAPDDKLKVYSFKAKFDSSYRDKWGIQSVFPEDLKKETLDRIGEITRTAYTALGLRDYGRVDLMLAPDGAVYVLEVNPNPNIAENEDLPNAAAQTGLGYAEFAEKIIKIALDRYRNG
ncbi:MAG: ATP-grasp domain-containing protein [bacterium]|nr:ATP-grasp domain-containing protein [bacterium]